MSGPNRTWRDIATEMSTEQDPQRMMRLAEELNSALEREERRTMTMCSSLQVRTATISGASNARTLRKLLPQ
jgi:hypothetical protein